VIGHYVTMLGGIAGGTGALLVGALADRYLARRKRERYRRENEAYERRQAELGAATDRALAAAREEERLMQQAREARERPTPKRKTSPFNFGQAVLEPICTPLYDTVTIDRAAPNATRRCFVDQAGKFEADCSPQWMSGGQLPAPRMMVIEEIGFRLEPAEFIEEPEHEREDRENILRNTWVRLKVGVKDYWTGKLSMLPYSIRQRRIALPPQQAFFLEFNVAGATPLHYNWRLTGILNGEFGMEVM